MGQRTKAMDTESPTSKFLYAIIKQIDLKLVDWNMVARDLGISNGHAARMRYSRFKGQIDPTRARKKTPKKVGKGDPKSQMSMQMQPGMPMSMPPQMSLQLVNPGLVPKAEPVDSQYQSSPFVKCEPGDHVPEERHCVADSEDHQHLPRSMSSGSMAPPPHMAQYVSNGLPFPMASSLPGSMPFSNLTPFGPYPMVPMPQDFHMEEFGMHSPFLHNAPMIAWGPTSAGPREHTPAVPQSETTPVSVKEEPEITQSKITETVPIKTEETVQKE